MVISIGSELEATSINQGEPVNKKSEYNGRVYEWLNHNRTKIAWIVMAVNLLAFGGLLLATALIPATLILDIVACSITTAVVVPTFCYVIFLVHLEAKENVYEHRAKTYLNFLKKL